MSIVCSCLCLCKLLLITVTTVGSMEYSLLRCQMPQYRMLVQQHSYIVLVYCLVRDFHSLDMTGLAVFNSITEFA